MGKIIRQHLVVYYLASIEEEVQLKFDVGEVDAAAWLDIEQIKKVLATREEDKKTPFDAIFEEQGRYIVGQRELGTLMDNIKAEKVEGGAIIESFSLGTIFVLRCWIAMKEEGGHQK